MTVKEQLAARVAQMSEKEAAETIRLIDQRTRSVEELPSLRELLDRTQAASDLSEDEAMDLAVEAVRAVRRERRDAA